MVKKLADLIEVKKIIALGVVGVYCGLAISGAVEANNFTTVATLIVGYYFGQSTANNSKK